MPTLNTRFQVYFGVSDLLLHALHMLYPHRVYIYLTSLRKMCFSFSFDPIFIPCHELTHGSDKNRRKSTQIAGCQIKQFVKLFTK